MVEPSKPEEPPKEEGEEEELDPALSIYHTDTVEESVTPDVRFKVMSSNYFSGQKKAERIHNRQKIGLWRFCESNSGDTFIR